MLIINKEDYQLMDEKIHLVNARNNGDIGYSFYIDTQFHKNGILGYIKFYVGFFKNKTFDNIVCKKWRENPCDLDSTINYIEIMYGKRFIDFIDSRVYLEFGNIIDDKIEMKFIVDDELIQMDYISLLTIVD